MDHSLAIKSLSHSFGEKEILSQVNLACKTGEVVGILGRNGSGKTTLFEILFGALKPDFIEIYLDDQLITNKTPSSTFIGYHPQKIMLPKNILVDDLISIYIPDGDDQNKIFYAKGINILQGQRVNSLSHGQQRYLQLLLVLNLKHYFILLDEPFSMVEPLYRELIIEKIYEYKAQKGFLITDHYYLDVLEISDKLNLLRESKLIPISRYEDLISLNYLTERSLLP
jgi:ABC-type multidrug transport system ATPase subunit